MEAMTQNQQILNFLKRGGSLTPMDALGLFGCFRLSARVYDLRNKGVPIKEIRVSQNGKKFSKYYIEFKDCQ